MRREEDSSCRPHGRSLFIQFYIENTIKYSYIWRFHWIKIETEFLSGRELLNLNKSGEWKCGTCPNGWPFRSTVTTSSPAIHPSRIILVVLQKSPQNEETENRFLATDGHNYWSSCVFVVGTRHFNLQPSKEIIQTDVWHHSEGRLTIPSPHPFSRQRVTRMDPLISSYLIW